MTWEEYTTLVTHIAHDMDDDFNGWLNWAHRVTDDGGREIARPYISTSEAIRLAFLCGIEQGVRYPDKYDCTIR